MGFTWQRRDGGELQECSLPSTGFDADSSRATAADGTVFWRFPPLADLSWWELHKLMHSRQYYLFHGEGGRVSGWFAFATWSHLFPFCGIHMILKVVLKAVVSEIFNQHNQSLDDPSALTLRCSSRWLQFTEHSELMGLFGVFGHIYICA